MSMERLTDIEVIGGQAHPVPKLEIQNSSGFEKIVCRLSDIEDILGDTYNLDRLRELVEADKHNKILIAPFVAMVEQSLMGGEMKPMRDQRFNGRYAVVYSDKKKWSCPLIDICGTPYNSGEAEERRNYFAKETTDA